MGMQSEPGNRNSIRFVLDGEIVELSDVSPSRTVLQFLREDLRRTGTKEGCAEGDCGACTVVVAEVDETGRRLSAQAVNSCIQFLPTLDGKELITVESLARSGLHPVQKAMVDNHGSQCGFCTPGFVMSLFALYKSNPAPGRRDIDDALAGNLCRCTGYSPIILAGLHMYPDIPTGRSWAELPAGHPASEDEKRRVEALLALQCEEPLVLTHGGQRYFAPRTIAQLADLVAGHPDATILAGGTDLGLRVTKALEAPDDIIFTGNVAELREMRTTDSHIEIGAAVNLSNAMRTVVLHYPDLRELFVRFASPPIRNAATLAGNIANGSPIGDSMPALMVLDAEVVVADRDSSRRIALADFFLAHQSTALRAGEFIREIRVPLPSPQMTVRSYKVSRRFDQDISTVCAACCITLQDDRIAAARVAYGGMAATPKRAEACERALTGASLTEETIRAAMDALDEDFEPISDLRASADYRRRVAGNLLRRFYLDVTGRRQAGVYDYGR